MLIAARSGLWIEREREKLTATYGDPGGHVREPADTSTNGVKEEVSSAMAATMNAMRLMVRVPIVLRFIHSDRSEVSVTT